MLLLAEAELAGAGPGVKDELLELRLETDEGPVGAWPETEQPDTSVMAAGQVTISHLTLVEGVLITK